MITNKDISIDKDGSIILNGDKYPLASQAEIDDIGDKIGDITQTGITGDSVADQLEDIADNLIIRSAGSSITITMPVVWGYFYPDQYIAKVPLPTIAPNTNYTITLVAVRADNVPDTVDILTGAEVVNKNNSYFEMRTPRNLSSYTLPNVTSCRTGLVRYTITFA